MAEIAGHLIPNQYDERKIQFSEEKYRIVDHLIQAILPDVLKKNIKEMERTNSKIALIVDSGTTLEQVFPRIKLTGLGKNIVDSDLEKLEIYTNSLSGSDAFCKVSGDYLREDQLHLFGGTQIEKYRAVIGNDTSKAMKDIEDEYKKENNKIIGLITANWLLVGTAHDKMIFCSSEEGHLDYKRYLAEIADTLIIVTPLGKLLTLDTTIELNEILRLKEENKPEYDGFKISTEGKRNQTNTILLTTFRNKSHSILHTHSKNLIIAHEMKKQTLYTLCEKRRPIMFDHNCSYQEQIEIEIPHLYMREHAFRVLQISTH
ncbi:MAG: hypothetical protein GY941_20400 [Planctomycetes bacterium]|nr:hypothetical protein [Planctomycetota bacterium]